MYSLVALLLTLVQTGFIIFAYLTQATGLFHMAVVYGSPFYLAMHMLSSEGALLGTSYIYLMILCFHVFKYFIFFRAQTMDDRNLRLWGAIALEAFYLCLCGYYLI